MRRDENAMEHETPTEPDTTPDATNGHGHDGADADSMQVIEKLMAERDEAIAAKLRAQADFANFQRRSVENEARARIGGLVQMTRALMPVLDHFDLALAQDHSKVTVEQMAILEPGLSETIGATLVTALRQATDAAVAKGVPKAAAWDFMLGHLGIELALLFEQYPGQFSDGAKLAIAKAMPRLFRDDWLHVLEPAAITESVKDICNPPR